MTSKPKMLYLIIAPFTCQLIYFASSGVLILQAEKQYREQFRAADIQSKAASLSKRLYDAGVALGGYSITKSPLFSDRFDKIARETPQQLTELKDLVGDNTRERQLVANISALMDEGLKSCAEAKVQMDSTPQGESPETQFRARHMSPVGGLRSITDRLQEQIHSLLSEEPEHLSEKDQFKALTDTIRNCFIAGIFLNGIIAAGMSVVLRKQ